MDSHHFVIYVLLMMIGFARAETDVLTAIEREAI